MNNNYDFMESCWFCNANSRTIKYVPGETLHIERHKIGRETLDVWVCEKHRGEKTIYEGKWRFLGVILGVLVAGYLYFKHIAAPAVNYLTKKILKKGERE